MAVLKADTNTRQAILQYWQGDLDLPLPIPRSADIPCNLVSHLMIRNGRLEWLQVMRSNDLIWGTPYNFIQFTTFQEIFAGWLGVEVGSYHHVSNSLHVYEIHNEYLRAPTPIDEYIKNEADLRLPYEAWEKTWSKIVDVALALTDASEDGDVFAALEVAKDVETGYSEWIHLLCAESLRRLGNVQLAQKVIAGAGSYWATTWEKWMIYKESQR
jgi:thymidylate synthase